MPPGTKLRNFRCDDDRWDAFMRTCAGEGTDASTQLRELIDGWLSARV